MGLRPADQRWTAIYTQSGSAVYSTIQIIQLNPQKWNTSAEKLPLCITETSFPSSPYWLYMLSPWWDQICLRTCLFKTPEAGESAGNADLDVSKKTKTGHPQFHGPSMSIYVHLCASELVGKNAGAQWTWLDKRSQTLRPLRTVCEGAKSWSMERKASPSSSTTWLLCPPWPHIDPFYGSKCIQCCGCWDENPPKSQETPKKHNEES